jgi:hypothetical protein
MALEITVLRLAKYREQYYRLRYATENCGLDDQTASILKRFGEFYNEFPEAQCIKPGVFLTWYFQTKNKAARTIWAAFRSCVLVPGYSFKED